MVVIQRRAPWYLLTPAAVIAAAVALPMAYLLWRAVGAETLNLLSGANVRLLANTLALTAGVLVFSTAVAAPIAFLTTHTDLPARRFFALLGVLPLAVPGYVMAFAMLGLGGYGGAWQRLTGQIIARPHGYWAALVALGLYNMPYVYLNLRAALLGIDPSLEEAGRSLGRGRLTVLVRIVMPQLRPALLAGALLVALHVIGDFGVVSLMQFETFSLALYNAYAGGAASEAALPALMLIVLAGLILLVDVWMLRGLTLHRTSAAVRPARPRIALGHWKLPAMALLMGIGLISVAAPTAMVVFWLFELPLRSVWNKVLPALVQSVSVSVPAAVAAAALALPIALLARRYPSRTSIVLERMAFMGYAVPALAFALSLYFFASRLKAVLGVAIYPGFVLLISAYSIHFLAEAIGPIRSGLYLATPRLEEASRGLGLGWFATLRRVTLPLLRPSLAVAAALVFLSVMKELPLTALLAPYDFDTLAMRVWDHSHEALYAEAAPFALCILLCSAAFVGVLLVSEDG